MNIAPKSSFVLNRPHLLGIEGLSREEIVGLLDLAEEFVELNRPEQPVSNKAESAVNACCGTTSPGLVLLCRGLSEHRVKQ